MTPLSYWAAVEKMTDEAREFDKAFGYRAPDDDAVVSGINVTRVASANHENYVKWNGTCRVRDCPVCRLDRLSEKDPQIPDKTMTTSAGRKDDNDKPRTDLLPPLAVLKVAECLGYGAKKYAPENWRKVPDLKARYTAAALRHLFKHQSGEVNDPESGLPHLAHAATSLLFVLEDQELTNKGVSHGG